MNGYRHGIEGNLAPIALKFFAAFSRFEFALKRGGYEAGQEGGRASANWIKFSADLGQGFFNKMKEAKEAGVFFREPPRRLTVKVGGGVEFTDQAALVNTQMLLEAVGLVRNNLFHGEKPHTGHRDEELLAASLFILDSAFASAQDCEDMQPVCQAFLYANINQH